MAKSFTNSQMSSYENVPLDKVQRSGVSTRTSGVNETLEISNNKISVNSTSKKKIVGVGKSNKPIQLRGSGKLKH
jgi:hypothetical protein